jgi:hypothetical protein
LNPKDLDDLAKKLDQALLFPNARADDLANTLYLTCPRQSDHEAVLASSLEALSPVGVALPTK